MIDSDARRPDGSSRSHSFVYRAALAGAVLGLVGCGGSPATSCADDACLSSRASSLSSPAQPGPRRTVRFDSTISLAGGGSLAVTVAGPSDDGREISRTGAPYPLVVFSPGFVIGRAQYNGYLERLASHGFVAVSQTSRAETNHAQYRDDTSKLLDWLISPTGISATRIAGRADKSRIGLAGHSLGGKISLLVAAKDSRVKSIITVDAVDGASAPLARDVVDTIRLPSGTPIGFLGETISKSGGLQPCAPAAFNYETLYGSTTSARFALRFLKAAHTDFVDNTASCFPCLFCPGGTAPLTQWRDLAIKYVTAYFLWTLAGQAEAASYLTGIEVQKDVAAGYVELTKP